MNLPHKNSKPLLIKILIIVKIIKMIMTIIIMIIIVMIILILIIIMMITKIIIIIIKITKIIKCKSIYRTPTTTNTELLVTLHNDGKPLSNIKKSPRKML